MNLSIWTLLTLIPPLLIIEGLFSGSEIALLSADKLALKRMSKRGHGGAKRALELASHPERVLSTTLLMTSLCVITISALIALYFLGQGAKHSDLLAVLVTSPLVVLFGELLPKTIYQRHATRLAPWIAYLIHATYWVFFPATRVLASYTNRLSRIIGPIEELLTGKRRSTREELRDSSLYTKKETEIKASEKRMIKRIFDFTDTEAKHALIPLVRVDAIEQAATVELALRSFERHRHSRMPVFSGRVDNIIGVLEAADLLSAHDIGEPIRHYIAPARYVAETQALEDLMFEMRREDEEMVVIVDEHGGAVGILTFEDIVEEIVGEISDEYDTESLPYKELAPGRWLAQARMEVELINETLKMELPQGEYETLSGFLLQQFGRIPEPRDELFFSTPAGPFKFVIHKATERQIESVLIERLESSS